jgi:hypothetical protein
VRAIRSRLLAKQRELRTAVAVGSGAHERQHASVDLDVPLACHRHDVARDTDDPLHQFDAAIVGKAEDRDVAALRLAAEIGDLVDREVVAR